MIKNLLHEISRWIDPIVSYQTMMIDISESETIKMGSINASVV